MPPNKEEFGRWHKSLLHPEKGALAKLLQSPSGIGHHKWFIVNFGATYMEEVGTRLLASISLHFGFIHCKKKAKWENVP